MEIEREKTLSKRLFVYILGKSLKDCFKMPTVYLAWVFISLRML